MATVTRWQDGRLNSIYIIGILTVHEYLEVISLDAVYNNFHKTFKIIDTIFTNSIIYTQSVTTNVEFIFVGE